MCNTNFVKKPLKFLRNCITIAQIISVIVFDHLNLIDIDYFIQQIDPLLQDQQILINQQNEALLHLIGIDLNPLPLVLKDQILRIIRESPENERPLGEIQRLIDQYRNILPSTPNEITNLAVVSPEIESTTMSTDIEYTTNTLTDDLINKTSVVKK